MAKAKTKPTLPTRDHVIGTVERRVLDTVKPNNWNPNRMTDFEREALRNGLQTDGWLSSQALLIWGEDDTGEQRDYIIDGEHRWTVARELGYVDGPMVVLDGLSIAQAKALTIKMNAKRGRFQEDLLAALVQDIQHDLDVADLGLDLGINPEELMRHLSVAEEFIEPSFQPQDRQRVTEAPEGLAPVVQQVGMAQLFYPKDQMPEFQRLAGEAGKQLGTKDLSSTILEALRLICAVEAT